MALDFAEIVLLIFANGLVDTLLGLAIGIAVVPKIAARKSKENLVTFLTGDESEALWAKQATRVVKAIQPQIDDRMGRMEALIRTEMPHPDATIADMKRDLESKFTELDRGITAALQSIDTSFRGVVGNMGQAEIELRKEMALVGEEGQSAIEEAVAQADTSNPVVRRLYAWAAKPVDPKLEAKNPIGAAALQLGKAALLDRLQNEGVGPATTRFLKKTGNWKPGLSK